MSEASKSAQKLRRLATERILVLDGAMGTMSQRHKLGEADYRGARFADWKQDLKGCNDLLVITKPAVIEDIHAFPPELAAAVLHIILSHHGQLEHGSPVVPATREATLVHMIDNLGGRLGSFDRLERQLPPGESWSGFDRALSGSAFFGDRQAA